jgi:hypothetical protein
MRTPIESEGRRTPSSAVIWVLAIVITLAAVTYQRIIGPTRPVRGSVTVGSHAVRYRLDRTHGGPEGYPLSLREADPSITGTVAYRRFKTTDPWTYLVLRREGGGLRATLPHQPPAGKLVYQVYLKAGSGSDGNGSKAGWAGASGAVAGALSGISSVGPLAAPEPPPGTVRVPASGPVVIRFRGAVPVVVLMPHVLLMFLGMLLSSRAGLEALRKNGDPKGHALLALGFLVLGGLVFGPAVQWFSFGKAWTGVPLGWDLTDNKTLIAVVAWGGAVLAGRGRRGSRYWVLAAAVVTLAIFSIPHSVLGSELDYSKLPPDVHR